MARILIAGCGDVGAALGVKLVADGHAVWGLKRNVATLPPGIEPIAADLTEAMRLRLPPKLDSVVYTAAAGRLDATLYQATYVDGVANVLNALRAAGQSLQRFILVSSTSVYAQNDGAWVDEDSPAVADDVGGRSLRQGEQLAWGGPYPATVIRFAGIYGPGRTRLIDSVRSGRASCVTGVYSNRIHRDDCAGALRHVLGLAEPAPLYIGVDDEPTLHCEVLRWLAARLGVQPPVVATSAGAAEARQRGNKRCRNARLKASGWRLRYPDYRAGYTDLLADYH